jgi:cellulose synthase/poly-beta-1,6-N-acetylglucosamine synthase-like glycosyltransferase
MPEPHPSISVLLPVYNDGATLGRAVRSIRNQTFTDWELLLLDDGSTDDSADRMERLSRADSRIRLVRLPHEGLSRTLNQGLSLAAGRTIARMDADDVSHPKRFSLQKDFLDRRPDICAVGCRIRLFPRARLTPGMRVYEGWLNSLISPEDISREIFVESPLAHPSVMVRREALEQAGGYETRGPEDYDLWLRLHGMGFRFAKVPQTLLWWMDRPDRISRCSPDYTREAFRRCKARHLADHLGQGTPVILLGNREAKRLAILLREQGVVVKGYVDINPGRIGTRHNGVPVLGYEDLKQKRPDCLMLAAVGTRGAREDIRRRLAVLGFQEQEAFLCVG